MNHDKPTRKLQRNENGRAQRARNSHRAPLSVGASISGTAEQQEAAEDAGSNLFALVNDRLSGRWPHAIALGVVLGALFAVLGYNATGMQYDAVGIIQVSPKINPLLRDTPETGLTPLYANYVETEARMVKSPRILERAIQHLDLHETPWETPSRAMRALHANLGARAERTTELITVTFRAESPALAQRVTNAVLQAYDEIRGSVERDQHARKINELRAQRAGFNELWRRKNREIDEYIASTGHAVQDFGQVIESRNLLIQDAEARIREIQNALEVFSARSAEHPALGTDTLVGERELEAHDLDLFELGKRRRLARLEYTRAQERLKPEHPDYIARRNHSDLMDRLYRERAEIVLNELLSSGHVPITTTPDDLKMELEQRRREIQEHTSIARQMRQWQSTISAMRIELEQLEHVRADIDYRIRQLEIEADQIRAGRIQIAARAEYPLRPSQDRRRPLAAIGAIGGLGMGLATFFLLGTIDRRVYAVRQLTSGPARGALCANANRLLGVLPALPQRPGDVETASVAAHCVHQIRNHIEGMRTDMGGPLVLVISSPYQGDGKTSLVMALGASYAATGSRVLLVDCDLVGKNLTAHSMTSGQPGLREALRAAGPLSSEGNGRIPKHTQTAPCFDVSDFIVSLSPADDSRHPTKVSVLPVGADPTFGPEMIRRDRLEALFDQLRDRFDVIVVDTGPLFGSIESLPAAAVADGVVLAMQRGRRHSRLEECVEELHAVGAKYLGVVLNHARISDCDRYVSKSRISAVVSAHEASTNGNGRSGVSNHAAATPRPARNALLRAMQMTARIES